MKDKIKVLICDDSALIRVTLRKMIESDQNLVVLDSARNGEEAIEKAGRLNPDVIIMDVNMPKLDGIAALREIVKQENAPVIMFSALTEEGAQATLDALEIGAFDYMPKPEGGGNLTGAAKELIQKIKNAADSNLYEILTGPAKRQLKKSTRSSGDLPVTQSPGRSSGLGFKAVTLGISTGGPKSIFKVLPELPKNLNAAILVVQHMPAAFIPTFVARINSKCHMECVESEPGMVIKPGLIYVGKGDYHFKAIKKSNRDIVVRQSKSPDHLFIPSVDIMMDSISDIFLADTIGVLMTGMGWDGAKGMVKISNLGGITIAESKETAIVFGMPQEAIKRGGAKLVVPNWQISSEIVKATNRIF